MKRYMVYGLGVSGEGAVKLLKTLGEDMVVVDDKKAISSEEGIKYLEDIDILVKSPGIPYGKLLEKAKEKGIEIIDEVELAYRVLKEKFPSVKLISVTGTNGKTTVTTKIKELLEYCGKKVDFGGNIGRSFGGLVEEMIGGRKLDCIVLELSSYQLENVKEFKSDISILINLTPDHISRYNSIDEYYDTKFNIFINQTSGEYGIINIDSNEVKKRQDKIKSKVVKLSLEDCEEIFTIKNKDIYYKGDLYLKGEDIKMKGTHNLENFMNVIAAGKILNLSDEKIKEFVENTSSLPHRTEVFYRYENMIFINDSKGTNIESTLMALSGYKNPNLIIGGEDKGLDLDPLIKESVKVAKKIYLIGDLREKLRKKYEDVGYKKIVVKETVAEVVDDIYMERKKGGFSDSEEVILFSPGTSSFDQFPNYIVRGDTFKDLVRSKFKLEG